MYSTVKIVAFLALMAPSALATDKVVVYESEHFKGRSLTLTPGEYDYHYLSKYHFDDTISSIKIPSGLKVYMCADPGFRTHCTEFTKSSSHVSVGDGVSSLRVYSDKRSECLKKGYKAHQCAAHGYRNRNLKAIDTVFLAENHKQCMNVHYDMYLVVEGVHFAGLAVPTGSECPSVVFHSSIADDKSVEKVAMLADDEEVATFDVESMHHLGSRAFGSIVSAFEKAPVGKDGAKFYDSITNNCVSLLRNMADPLDVPVDDAMVDFVTKKLVSTADINLWDGIKNSPSLNLLVEGGKRMLRAANQEDLVRKLIKLYV